jgi:hypothetical protein
MNTPVFTGIYNHGGLTLPGGRDIIVYMVSLAYMYPAYSDTGTYRSNSQYECNAVYTKHE